MEFIYLYIGFSIGVLLFILYMAFFIWGVIKYITGRGCGTWHFYPPCWIRFRLSRQKQVTMPLVKMHKTELVKNCHAFTLHHAAICLYFRHFRQQFRIMSRGNFRCRFMRFYPGIYIYFACLFPSVRGF